MEASGFAAVAVLTLSLGIGANAAIFSVVNGVLLRPCLTATPTAIMTVAVTRRGGRRGARAGLAANFLDFRERNQSFEIWPRSGPMASTTRAGEPETFQAWLVSEGFFEAAGAARSTGATFLPESTAKGATRRSSSARAVAAPLRRRPRVVGQQLVLDGKPRTVVGVMPPEFHYLDKREMIAPYIIGEHELQRRVATYLNVVGRLKPGVTLEQARSDMSNVAARLAEEYPQANREMGAAVVPLSEQMVGRVRPALWVLFGAVGFVLLIACANVANLMIARGPRGRGSSPSARRSGRARPLVRQLLTERCVLASWPAPRPAARQLGHRRHRA